MVPQPQHPGTSVPTGALYHQLPLSVAGMPPGAIFFTTNHYPHTHMTPEPCRTCPGCVQTGPGGNVEAVSMPLHPSSHHHRQQHNSKSSNTCFSSYPHRSGAWNHGMIGPYSTTTTTTKTNGWVVPNTNRQQSSQQQHQQSSKNSNNQAQNHK